MNLSFLLLLLFLLFLFLFLLSECLFSLTVNEIPLERRENGHSSNTDGISSSSLSPCVSLSLSLSLVFYFPSSITSFSLSFVFIHFEEQNTSSSSSSTHHDDDDDHHPPSLFLLHKSSFPGISIRKSFSFQWFFSFKIGSEFISMIKKIDDRCSLIDHREKKPKERRETRFFSFFLLFCFCCCWTWNRVLMNVNCLICCEGWVTIELIMCSLFIFD